MRESLVRFRMRARHRRASALLLCMLLSAMGAACGGRHSNRDNATKPIDECESFLLAQRECLASLGADVAASAEATRASLYAQLAQHPDARDALAARCVAESARVKTSCQ